MPHYYPWGMGLTTILRALLFLFTNTFKRFVVMFHIHNAAGFRIALYPMPIRVLELRTVINSTISVTISGFAVFSHVKMILKQAQYFRLRFVPMLPKEIDLAGKKIFLP